MMVGCCRCITTRAVSSPDGRHLCHRLSFVRRELIRAATSTNDDQHKESIDEGVVKIDARPQAKAGS